MLLLGERSEILSRIEELTSRYDKTYGSWKSTAGYAKLRVVVLSDW